MSRMTRTLGARVGALALLACLATACARDPAASDRQRSDSAPAPDRAAKATSINESMFMRVGGIDQWIQIRGDDRANPVLLWVNGGPGGSTIPGTWAYRSWERQFTVVMWDQRGEGKTFEKHGESLAGPMTVEQMTSDGIEVAEFLRQHLRQQRIILLGHSWGSILGIHMIERRPGIFAAYVGTGQVTQLLRQTEAAYPQLLARAAPGSEAAKELTALGPPPWQGTATHETVNKWAGIFEPPFAPASEEDRTLKRPTTPEPEYIKAGGEFSERALSDEMVKVDLPAFATHFAVPIVFIQGEDDLATTTSLVRQYFEQIVADRKRFIELPAAGHAAIFRNKDAFLEQLILHVRPLARAGGTE